MYSLKNLFAQEPANVAGALMLVLNAVIIVFHVPLTAVQTAALNGALVPVLNLFYVRPLTASKSALNELAKKKPTRKK